MTLEVLFSGISVLISIIAVIATVRMYRKSSVKIECSILDSETPLSANTKGQNLKISKKILQIRNVGRSTGGVTVDVWSEQNLVLPPEVHTSQEYRIRCGQPKNGFYGRYVNVQIYGMKPKTSLELHLCSLYVHVKQSNFVFFEKVDVSSDQGNVQVVDKSIEDPFPDQPEVIPYNISPRISSISTSYKQKLSPPKMQEIKTDYMNKKGE